MPFQWHLTATVAAVAADAAVAALKNAARAVANRTGLLMTRERPSFEHATKTAGDGAFAKLGEPPGEPQLSVPVPL